MTDYGHEARELELYLGNTEGVYRAYLLPCLRNAERKWAKGTFDKTLGIKLFRYPVDAAAKNYTLEHGSIYDKWSKLFSVSDRNKVAEHFVDYFVAEMRCGNSFL